jgi:hypothetical protein
MPSGSGGQLALTRSDSLYLSVQSVDRWHNFVSESMEHTIAELEEGAITGYKDAPPSHKGIDSAQGDITIEPDPNALGDWMRGVFGQSSGTILCQAGSTATNSQPMGAGRPVIRHRFLPIQSAVDDRNFLPAYTMMIYRDLGSAFFYQGMCAYGLELNFQAGALLSGTVNVMARKVERFARTSSISALTKIPGSKPWIWDQASVQVSSGQVGLGNLVANTNYESLAIGLQIPIEGVVLLDGTKYNAEYQVNDFRRVSLNGTISFRSQEEYDAFAAYENRSMRVTARETSSASVLGNPSSAFYPTIQIDIPQAKYLTWSTPIGGPNRLQTTFTGKAERDTTSLYMIEAFLTNVTSAY